MKINKSFALLLVVVTYLVLFFKFGVYHEPVTEYVKPVEIAKPRVLAKRNVKPPTPDRVLAVNLPAKLSKRYKNLNKPEAKRVIRTVYELTKKNRINPVLMLGLIAAESSFNKDAVSPMGAQGYTQVLARYHEDKINGRDLTDLDVNVQVGVKILSDCMRKRKTERGALACYNGARKKSDIDKYVGAVYAQMNLIENMIPVKRPNKV